MSTKKSTKRTKLTSLEKKWILYDVANSAFTLMVSTLFSIYFGALFKNDAGLIARFGDKIGSQQLAYWNYAGTICTIIVALLGPVLGTIADRHKKRKQLFILTVVLGAGCTLLMGTATGWLYFLIVFVIAKIWYQASLVIYDSMINDVTSDDRSDSVSSYGFAFGYIGSVIPFIVCLVLYLLAHLGKLPFDDMIAMRISFVITALWWFVFSLPLMKEYRQIHTESEAEAKTNGFAQFLASVRDLAATNRKALYFVIGFFFYIDGVYTIIGNASAYADSLGLNSVAMLEALLVTQIVAFPCAILTGRLAKKIGPEKVVMACILGYTGIAVIAFFLDTELEFWILCVLVGVFQGGIQALSRSYFARIIPKSKSGQYFSIYDIFGKGATAIGGLILGAVSAVTGRQNMGILPIIGFFVVGAVLFYKSAKTPSSVAPEDAAD